MQKITPFLWFDNNAEEAVNFYVSVFKNSKIGTKMRSAGETPSPATDVLTVSFELNGQEFVAMNGGPAFKFNESVSFVVYCDDQDEVDYYWTKLLEGGEESQCGWLKDKFGLSWQITPNILIDYLCGSDREKAERVFNAMLTMRKIEIDKIQAAYDGG
jgi:predicted 3-demethylubiquinone-9 3-methyltransferase (glyoxalase superfamily)